MNSTMNDAGIAKHGCPALLRFGSAFSVFAVALLMASCASEKPRDPEFDKRTFDSVAANQPQASNGTGRGTGNYRLSIWQRDLDAVDNRAFARAVSGLRNNLSAYLSLMSAQRLPESARGRQAVAGLIQEGFASGVIDAAAWPEAIAESVEVLVRPRGEAAMPLLSSESAPEVAVERERRLRAMLSVSTSDETPDSVAARLAAVTVASRLDDSRRAALMHWRLFDPMRPLRWAAGEFFRQHPRHLTREILSQLLLSVRSGHRELRADSALLLADLERRLDVRIPGGSSAALTLDPHASESVRLKQLAAWETWLANAEPALARLRATAPEKDSGDSGD